MSAIPHMRSRGKEPLVVFPVNGNYLLAVYQGKLSKFDLLLKYRQKDSSTKTGWSRIRTPKHIHWTIDIMIKMNSNPKKTKEFVNFLLDYWDRKVVPLKTSKDRNKLLTSDLLNQAKDDASRYKELANQGEYSIKFLLLIAKLLMIQEKTNLNSAYMFKKLLKALKEGKDIFKIISIATHGK